jgi:hypothetical protein
VAADPEVVWRLALDPASTGDIIPHHQTDWHPRVSR